MASLPRFEIMLQLDMPYGDLRKALLRDGWTPTGSTGRESDLEDTPAVLIDIPELENSSAEGFSVMTFQKMDVSGTLRVLVYGDLRDWNVTDEESRLVVADWTLPGSSASAPKSTQRATATSRPISLSDLIGRGEGGYNAYNRGRPGDAGGREIDFSRMTMADIMRRQDLPRNDPNRLFAVGKFQIIPSTMKETVRALKLQPNSQLTPELQERMFADYLIDEKRPAVRAYITGRSSGRDGLRRAQIALAQEFASVADPRTGRSFYDGDSGGNRSSISARQVEASLDLMRSRYAANILKGMTPTAAYRVLGQSQGST